MQLTHMACICLSHNLNDTATVLICVLENFKMKNLLTQFYFLTVTLFQNTPHKPCEFNILTISVRTLFTLNVNTVKM